MNNGTKVLVTILALLFVCMVVFVLPYLLVKTVQQTTAQAVAPIQQVNEQLRAQVFRLMNPTPTVLPDPITIIHDVRSLARLETIEYSIEKVITAETGQDQLSFLFGDKLLFVAHGNVIAGVDLSRLADQDMWVNGNTLNVRLPEAEIFAANLDNQRSYVYNRETGLLTHGDVNLESLARQQAEAEIVKAAKEDGILKTARANAENYLTRLLGKLGYKDVQFIQPAPQFQNTPEKQTTPQLNSTPLP